MVDMGKIRKYNRLINIILVVVMILTMVTSLELIDLLREQFFVEASMTIGDAGSLGPGVARTSESGIAGSALSLPPVRISLYRNEKVLLEEENGLIEIFDKLKWGYPENLSGSIYLMHPNVFKAVGNYPVSVAQSNTGARTLDYKSSANFVDNIIKMGGSSSSGGVYYNTMKSMGLDEVRQNWRSIATEESKSLGVWSYVVQNEGGNYNLADRINEVFNVEGLDYNNIKDWTVEEQETAFLRYLDMLMSIYTIAKHENKEIWAQAIDDLLQGDNLTQSPISICIDAAAFMVFHSTTPSKKYYLMVNALDYLNFIGGVGKSFAVNEDPWWSSQQSARIAGGDSYEQILTSVQNSINTDPYLDRLSDHYCDYNNGFSFGSTSITKKKGAIKATPLTTGGRVAKWYNSTGSKANVHFFNLFKFNPPGTGDLMYGYMISPAPTKPINCQLNLELRAEPKDKVIDTETLGVPVILKLSSKIEQSSYGAWEQVINNAKKQGKNFTLKVNFERTSSVGSFNGLVPMIDPNPVEIILSPDKMMEFIYGSWEYIVSDDVSGLETGDLKSILFYYKANVNIEMGDKEKEWEGEPEDFASFIVIGEKLGYTSRPEAYSEIKNYGSGSNMSGTLREDWEAMAGVPSTEQLYFAAGGSEFIVDITVEYVEDEVAKRSYESIYTKTDCEFKDGDTAKPRDFPSPIGGGSGNVHWDPHAGGSFTVTWTGIIPNLATAVTENGMGDVTAVCPAQPDRTDYDQAKSEAQDYVQAVNSTVFEHTAASDGITRVKTAWGASITTDAPMDPQDTSDSDSSWHEECSGSGDEEVCWDVPDPVSATADPGPDGSYTISVTWSIPAHIICGPCCCHVLPEIHDTWAQTWQYDSMKIADVHVWKIDQGAVNGLEEIIATDVVGAKIVKGEPNIFYNIALKNDANFTNQTGKGGATKTSRVGRARYSVEPRQHDTVVYNNGVRTNKCDGLAHTHPVNVIQGGGGGHNEHWSMGFIYEAFQPPSSTSGATKNAGHLTYPTNEDDFLINNTDDRDKATDEYAKFLEQRNELVLPTMITDFLILQTSQGDQSVIYFHKDGPEAVKTESEIPELEVAQEEMWEDNENSASKWEEWENEPSRYPGEGYINVGSYNGDFSTPSKKFNRPNNGNVAKTYFEPDPAGTIVKPVRPKNMMLYEGELNIILEDKNKSYLTGKAEVFWANALHWVDKSSPRFQGVSNALETAPYPTDMKIGPITKFNFGARANYKPEGPSTGGYIIEAPYSCEHTKINDIIVHDPVSTQYAYLESLPKSRDQRTGEILGGAASVIDNINSSKVCPRDPALCEFRVLNCTYFNDVVVADFDFSTTDNGGNPINKASGNSLVLPTGFSLTSSGGLTGRALDARGTRIALPFSELKLNYQVSTKIVVEADIKMSKPSSDIMIFGFEKFGVYVPKGQEYATLTTGNGWERKIIYPVANGVKHNIKIEFSFNSVDKCRVWIDGNEGYQRIEASEDINISTIGNSFYIGSWGHDNRYSADFYLDNFKITRLGGTPYHTDDCYKMIQVHPSGLNAHKHTKECLNGTAIGGGTGSKTFSYTGGVQTFTAPAAGTYTLEVWGAEGGVGTNYPNHIPGKGGYSKGNITLNEGQTIYVYVGGKGGAGGAAGWNGGGTGGDAGHTGAGGGGTDIRTTQGNLNTRVIVAGGGGGVENCWGYSPYKGGDGGGSVGGSGTSSVSNGYGTGGSQTGGGYNLFHGNGYGSLGKGGDGHLISTCSSGGGGGYYGGGAAYGGNAGGGSGYIGGVTSGSMSTGVRSGHGQAKITWDAGPTYSGGAQWFIDEYTNGGLTEQEARNILGDAYDPIMANSFGPVIHTWSGWTSSNNYGFNPNPSGNVTTTTVPVDFSAAGVQKISVELSANTTGKLTWTRGGSTYSLNGTVNSENNKIIDFVVRNNANWKDTITQLKFDLGTSVKIINIKVYGGGTKTSSGTSSGGTGASRIFNNTSTGTTGANVNNSSGTLGGSVTMTNGMYKWTVPMSGSYKIEAYGAQGGAGTSYSATGGKGARMTGDFTLNSGEQLLILVGQSATGGYRNGGGGGGGTYVTKGTSYSSSTALIVAAGGGGTSLNDSGGSGNSTTGGTSGGSSPSGSYPGGGGGGFIGNGGSGYGSGGSAFRNLGYGGAGHGNASSGWGGFGGGGGNGWYGGGGGGGYQGGNGGSTDGIAGKGGYSYNSGTNQLNSSGYNSGHGKVVISSLFNPVTIIGGGGSSGGVSEGQKFDFNYTGGVQQKSLPAGKYKLEVWGAEGNSNSYTAVGGKGGYSVGELSVNSDNTVYIYIGGKAGYNGGGTGGTGANPGANGGGATDIRIGSTAAGNRVIVAGGGGGGGASSNGGSPGNRTSNAGGEGGYGHTGSGSSGGSNSNYNGKGGSSGSTSSGGAGGAGGTASSSNSSDGTYYPAGGGGGGGGYYGGGGGGSGGYWGNGYSASGKTGGSGSSGSGGAGGNSKYTSSRSGWYSYAAGGGGGGSGYVGGVTNGVIMSGGSTIPKPSGGTQMGNEGNGFARITALYVEPDILLSVDDIKAYWELIPDYLPNGTKNPIWGCDYEPNIHVCDSKCRYVKTLVCTEPHHKGMHYDPSNPICWEACCNDENHRDLKPVIDTADGSFTPGNFVNIDYGFRIYFPNRGDFYEGEPYGISSITSQRGKNFKNSMSTTKWTRVKRIKFEFNVIYKDKLYKSGEWITLGDRGKYTGIPGSKYLESKWTNYGTEIYNDISKSYYEFYCVLANFEAKSASIDVEVEAVNCPGPNDNLKATTNRRRGKFTALHGGYKIFYADVVGRIGNLVVLDTGDYRFANFFKMPLDNTVAPKPTIYGVTNGMEPLGDAVKDKFKINANGKGSGAYVSNIDVSVGLYKVDIDGSGLNNGKLEVSTPQGIDLSDNRFIENILNTNDKKLYYLLIPQAHEVGSTSDIKKIDIKWIANNSNTMKIDNISLVGLKIPDKSWIIDGVVRTVDESRQNYYMTWIKDIRGEPISSSTNYLNTYNTQDWIDGKRVQLPVSAEHNNIDVLKGEQVLVGYPIYFDISTLGNYWWNDSSEIQVVPYYYALNLENKEIIPVDAYFISDDEYKPVNIHGLVTPNWNGSGIYNYVIELDWLAESVRRNYTDTEKNITDLLRGTYNEVNYKADPEAYYDPGLDSELNIVAPRQLKAPLGSSYILGNAQLLKADGRARTFIGGETTYGKLMNLGGSYSIIEDEHGRKYNPGGRLSDYLWWESAQRWHLKLGLPSSTVFIRHGQEPTSETIKEFDSNIKNNDYVVLCTADIRVLGDTYVLKYDHKGNNGKVKVKRKDGRWTEEITLPDSIPPVIAIYSTTKTSKFDVGIVGVH